MTATLTEPGVTALGPRPRFRDTLLCERTKLRTVRSTWWTLFAVFAVTLAFGAIVTAAIVGRWDRMSVAQRLAIDPTARSLTGFMLSQLFIGVLGVLAITSEYSGGMIRSTLAAMPHRRQLLAAKAISLAPPVFLVGAVSALLAFLSGQAILSNKGIGVSLGAPQEWRAVLGAGLVLALEALIALGLGAMIRQTAGAIASYVGVLLVAQLILSALPDPYGRDITEYFPFNAGRALMKVHTSPDLLPPWSGLAVLVVWAVVSLGVAGWLITRRDA